MAARTDKLSLILAHSAETNATTLLVFQAIAMHDGRGGGASPSYATLASLARCSRTTAWRATRRLVGRGELAIRSGGPEYAESIRHPVGLPVRL